MKPGQYSHCYSYQTRKQVLALNYPIHKYLAHSAYLPDSIVYTNKRKIFTSTDDKKFLKIIIVMFTQHDYLVPHHNFPIGGIKTFSNPFILLMKSWSFSFLLKKSYSGLPRKPPLPEKRSIFRSPFISLHV